MSDPERGDDRLLLPVAEAARRLRVGVSTVIRAMDDGTFPFITFRGTRRIAAPLVDYVVAAIMSGRSGSVEEFAAEWSAQRERVTA